VLSGVTLTAHITFATLHYITLHYITLHYITSHHITLFLERFPNISKEVDHLPYYTKLFNYRKIMKAFWFEFRFQNRMAVFTDPELFHNLSHIYFFPLVSYLYI